MENMHVMMNRQMTPQSQETKPIHAELEWSSRTDSTYALSNLCNPKSSYLSPYP